MSQSHPHAGTSGQLPLLSESHFPPLQKGPTEGSPRSTLARRKNTLHSPELQRGSKCTWSEVWWLPWRRGGRRRGGGAGGGGGGGGEGNREGQHAARGMVMGQAGVWQDPWLGAADHPWQWRQSPQTALWSFPDNHGRPGGSPTQTWGG